MMCGVDVLLQRELHVVAQVVEAKLVVGAVGDVLEIGFAPGAGPQAHVARVVVLVAGLVDVTAAEFIGVLALALDDADGEAHDVVDRAHPDRVAACEVVVDGNEVRALAGERVEHDRRDLSERLSFTGLHLGDSALVQDDAADELDVVLPHSEGALADLADDREDLGENLLERLAVLDPRLELLGFGRELVV